MTEANNRNWNFEGAKADRRIEDFWLEVEVEAVTVDADFLADVAVTFLPIVSQIWVR